VTRSRSMTTQERSPRRSTDTRRFERAIRLACLRQWWYTAIPEVALGAWCVAAGLILIFAHTGEAVSLPGWILLAISLALPIALVRILDISLVIPGGICIDQPQRTSAQRALVATAFVTFLILAAYDAAVIRSVPMGIGLGCACGLTAAYAYCDRARLLVEAAAVVIPFTFVVQLAGLLSLSGSRAYGLMLLIVGLIMLCAALPALVRAFELDDERFYDLEDTRFPDPSDWYTPQQLRHALEVGDTDHRLLTLLFLEIHSQPELLPALIGFAHDDDPVLARQARRALSVIWGPDPDDLIRGEIERNLDGRAGRTHVFTAEQLRELDRRRIAAERRSLKQERRVEEVLGGEVAHDQTALSNLLELAGDDTLVADDDREARIVAAELLGSTHDHRAYATLVQLILGGDRFLKEAAAEGFRGAAPEAAIHLRPLFADAREWVRVNAVNAALGLLDALDERGLPDASVARDLLRDDVFGLARHPSPVTRAMSLELLSAYGAEAVPDLEDLCTDRYAFVRGEALRALALTDAAAALPHVSAGLRDPRAYVRLTALNCTGYLRERAMLPVVDELLHDSDAQVALLARRVLLVAKTW